MRDAREAMLVAKTSAGDLTRRPLSPHLGIYRWPVTMVASILNRATGIALSVGALMLVCWLLSAALGPQAFAAVQAFLRSPVGLLMLFGWTLSLFYHLFGGLRHLAWDMGVGFAHRSLNPVSYLIFGLTAAATLLVWVVAYLKLDA